MVLSSKPAEFWHQDFEGQAPECCSVQWCPCHFAPTFSNSKNLSPILSISFLSFSFNLFPLHALHVLSRFWKSHFHNLGKFVHVVSNCTDAGFTTPVSLVTPTAKPRLIRKECCWTRNLSHLSHCRSSGSKSRWSTNLRSPTSPQSAGFLLSPLKGKNTGLVEQSFFPFFFLAAFFNFFLNRRSQACLNPSKHLMYLCEVLWSRFLWSSSWLHF